MSTLVNKVNSMPKHKQLDDVIHMIHMREDMLTQRIPPNDKQHIRNELSVLIPIRNKLTSTTKHRGAHYSDDSYTTLKDHWMKAQMDFIQGLDRIESLALSIIRS